jgi:membrane protein YdbS with pleckstrin-like domain
MMRFWRELTFTLAQIGVQEFLVLSMCMMSIYLYMIASSWTLILTLIVPLLMVILFLLIFPRVYSDTGRF